MARFIVFEGIEHCGKDTQIALLKQRWQDEGLEALFTREPTTQRYKEICNEFAIAKNAGKRGMELQTLFIEDRKQHLDEEIIPSLNIGLDVVSNRYLFSTLAYGMSEGVQFDELYEPQKEFLTPDLTIYLEISPDTAMARAKNANKEAVRFDRVDFLRDLHENYLFVIDTLCQKVSDHCELFHTVIIDGEKDIATVQHSIDRAIDKLPSI